MVHLRLIALAPTIVTRRADSAGALVQIADNLEDEMGKTIRLASLPMLLVLGVGLADAEPLKIRAGWVVLSDWSGVWMEKKDLAVHYGQSYVFDPIHYAGTPVMITALANNELEIASLAYSTLPIAIVNGGMDDITVIADDLQDGVDGYHSDEFDVLADGPIHKVEDLKGKILATNAAGSALDVAMKAMLRQSGLMDKRDYTVIEAPFPTMKAMLAQKKADLVPLVPPFNFDPGLKKIARPLFFARDALGVSQLVIWCARKPFIDQHRAALVDFLEDTLRMAHWYLDTKNHDAVEQIAARITKQPADQFGWLYTKDDYYRDPNMVPNLEALQKNVDLVSELGFVKASVAIKTHADLTVVEAAARRLK